MMTGMLDERLTDLLRASVEEYIKSASPIASNTLVGKTETNFSSATIRNDLKMLEQMGLLRQIHTSGGRVPTTSGYRAYVDSTNNVTFAADLINDMQELSRLVNRIERKLYGGNYPITPSFAHVLERRKNIYRLLEIPDLETSAFYLIIKEKIEGGRNGRN